MRTFCFRRAKSNTKGQLGFTLIELTVAIAVGSLILAAAATTLYQMWNNNMRNTAHMIAIKQIENCLHFLVRDVQMAQTVQTTGLPSGVVLRLGWESWDGSTNWIDYTWASDNQSLSRIRSQDGISTVVAYSVYPAPVFSSANNPKVTADITCTVQGISEERSVQIQRRPGS